MKGATSGQWRTRGLECGGACEDEVERMTYCVC